MFGIEEVLSWIRRQVGLRTDAADPAGSLHAKVGDVKLGVSTVNGSVQYGTLIREVIASNNLRLSADAFQSTASATYVCVKQIKVTQSGVYRIAFDLRQNASYSGYTVYGRVYVNDVARGTERATSITTYTTYTEDIYIPFGATAQLYIKTAGNGVVECQNFRIYFDHSATALPAGGVVWQN